MVEKERESFVVVDAIASPQSLAKSAIPCRPSAPDTRAFSLLALRIELIELCQRQQLTTKDRESNAILWENGQAAPP